MEGCHEHFGGSCQILAFGVHLGSRHYKQVVGVETTIVEFLNLPHFLPTEPCNIGDVVYIHDYYNYG